MNIFKEMIMYKVNNLVAIILSIHLFSCSSENEADNKTLFGVGGTTGLLSLNGGGDSVVAQLRSANLSRDPTQLPTTLQEGVILNDFDSFRTLTINRANTLGLKYSTSINILNQRAGIVNSPAFVEDDIRLNSNPSLSNIAGGHAGHSYISIDGKFIDILNEIANYMAKKEIGFTTESFDQAVKNIVSIHNASFGGAIQECCYPLDDLTAAERVLSDDYFRSMFGAVYFHEYAHYYLYAALDLHRGQFDISGIILYSSTTEDDADFISGALISKAGLNPSIAVLELDLMTYYSGRRIGIFDEFSEVSDNALVQFSQVASTYSPLATRKANFLNGYNRY